MWSVPPQARNEANSARRPPQLNGASVTVCAIKRTVCAMERTVFGENSGLYCNPVSLDHILTLVRWGCQPKSNRDRVMDVGVRVNKRNPSMKQSRLWLAVLVGATFSLPAAGQVPHLINYTGAVAVGGTNFNGYGQFKFALINHDGSATFWSNDSTSVAGSEPQAGLTLAVGNGVYDVALGDSTMTNMVPIPTTVFTNSKVTLRVWFSDGVTAFEPILPDQPVAAVGYAMMAANVADGSVTASKLAAGAVTAGAIAPGAVGASALAPNSAASSLGASGGLVLSDQGSNLNLLTNGFQKIGTVTVDSDAWQTISRFSPAPVRLPGVVWSGTEMLVWGGVQANGQAVNGGGRYNPVSDTWLPMSVTNAPAPRQTSLASLVIWTGSQMIVLGSITQPGGLYTPETDSWTRMSAMGGPVNWSDKTAVWTGHELLVWGGSESLHSYDPAHNQWSSLPSSSLAPRQGFTAIWSGTEMIVWGSAQTSTHGAAYNPATQTWRGLSKTNAPTARTGHSAVWTGRYMIVWGGTPTQSSSPTSTGAFYDPFADTWTALNTNAAPAARTGHLAFWDGQDMIIWGGTGRDQFGPVVLGDGARYRLDGGSWSAISPLKAPSPLPNISGVWTGSEMVLWGGGGEGGRGVQYPTSNAGTAYRPATDQWRTISVSPVGRIGHSLVWSGSEMVVWGGGNNTADNRALSALIGDSGARFDPITARWAPLSKMNAPNPRVGHQAVWSGKDMIVWGGMGMTNASPSFQQVAQPLATGARYNLASDEWTSMDTNGAPSPRIGFSMVWSGSEALVFGGQSGISLGTGQILGNGARYNPDTDSWASMTSGQAPAPRTGHSAVWTGKEMIVWGGWGQPRGKPSGFFNDGARYNPALNSWTPISTNNAPAGRTNHIAVWTGREMLIWGGTPRDPGLGGRYDPVLDRWTTVSLAAAPLTLGTPVGVWTGHDLFVWGSNSSVNRTGARYNPQSDSWAPTTLVGAPDGRSGALGIWTGDAVLIFGGQATLGSSNLPEPVLSYTTHRSMFLYGSTHR